MYGYMCDIDKGGRSGAMCANIVTVGITNSGR